MKPRDRWILASVLWTLSSLAFIWAMNHFYFIFKWWLAYCHSYGDNAIYIFILPILLVVSIPIGYMWKDKK